MGFGGDLSGVEGSTFRRFEGDEEDSPSTSKSGDSDFARFVKTARADPFFPKNEEMLDWVFATIAAVSVVGVVVIVVVV